VGIEPVLEARRQMSSNHRGTRKTVIPGNQLPFVVQAGGDAVDPVGAIHVVLNILFAGPDNLHGTIDMPGDLDGADGAVGLQPPAKAAAEQMIVDDDL